VLAAAALLTIVGLAALVRAAAGPWLAVAPGRLAIPIAGSIRAAAAPARRSRRVAALAGSLVAGAIGYGVVVAGETAWSGVPSGPARYRIDRVVDGSPAHGQLIAGDIVLAVDGREMTLGPGASRSFLQAIQAGGETVELQVRRDGGRRLVTVTPALDEASGQRRIGVQLGRFVEVADASAGDLVRRAATAPALPVEAIAALTRTGGELAGPVAMVVLASDPAQQRRAVLTGAGLVWLALAMLDLGALFFAGLPRDHASSAR
jgi:hypothetical protein